MAKGLAGHDRALHNSVLVFEKLIQIGCNRIDDAFNAYRNRSWITRQLMRCFMTPVYEVLPCKNMIHQAEPFRLVCRERLW